MRINNVIKTPIITEKSLADADLGRYTFKVDLAASQGTITQALKELFGVDAVEVRTMVMPGKRKRILRTNRFTKTGKWKKAIAILKSGQKIDLFDKAK